MKRTSVLVFAVSDLLEQILLELCDECIDAPQLDLFVLQRVNKTFKRTIETSPLLQCRMLLRCDSDGEDLDWPTPVKWLSRIGLFPDLWIHSHKLFGPCLQFGDGSVRVDSGLGFVDTDEPEGLLCSGDMRRKLDYRSASWRNMKLPMRWHGRELTYCMTVPSHQGTPDVMFWLRSGQSELTMGNLYDQVKAISDIGAQTGIALASYCHSNVRREVLLCLQYFLPVAWLEHRDGLCMRSNCMFCRGLYWVDSLPLAVDWPLDGSRLSLPHKGTRVVMDYLGYSVEKKRCRGR